MYFYIVNLKYNFWSVKEVSRMNWINFSIYYMCIYIYINLNAWYYQYIVNNIYFIIGRVTESFEPIRFLNWLDDDVLVLWFEWKLLFAIIAFSPMFLCKISKFTNGLCYIRKLKVKKIIRIKGLKSYYNF